MKAPVKAPVKAPAAASTSPLEKKPLKSTPQSQSPPSQPRVSLSQDSQRSSSSRASTGSSQPAESLSALHTLCQRASIKLGETYSGGGGVSPGSREPIPFECTLVFETAEHRLDATGVGNGKKKAKREAAEKLLEKIAEVYDTRGVYSAHAKTGKSGLVEDISGSAKSGVSVGNSKEQAHCEESKKNSQKASQSSRADLFQAALSKVKNQSATTAAGTNTAASIGSTNSAGDATRNSGGGEKEKTTERKMQNGSEASGSNAAKNAPSKNSSTPPLRTDPPSRSPSVLSEEKMMPCEHHPSLSSHLTVPFSSLSSSNLRLCTPSSCTRAEMSSLIECALLANEAESLLCLLSCGDDSDDASTPKLSCALEGESSVVKVIERIGKSGDDKAAEDRDNMPPPARKRKRSHEEPPSVSPLLRPFVPMLHHLHSHRSDNVKALLDALGGVLRKLSSLGGDLKRSSLQNLALADQMCDTMSQETGQQMKLALRKRWSGVVQEALARRIGDLTDGGEGSDAVRNDGDKSFLPGLKDSLSSCSEASRNRLGEGATSGARQMDKEEEGDDVEEAMESSMPMCEFCMLVLDRLDMMSHHEGTASGQN